jgi:FdhD protein
MARPPLETRPILKMRGPAGIASEDWVAVEEPLEIRVAGESLAVVMRTPGDDIELAAGFALTEGVVASIAEVGTIAHCEEPETGGPARDNIIDISLAPGVTFDRERLRRALMASAACGLCGKASLEALATRARPSTSALRVPRDILAELPGRLRAAQRVFDRTGALHGAGIFDAEGTPLACREDVGRHNAVDKVIGHALLHDIPISAGILMVSGRTSFEILQKAAVAGIPIVCAVSGPTTLAIETALAFNITLVNFLRGQEMNIATCPERVTERVE